VHTFNTFTVERGSMDIPLKIEPMLAGRYPPYSAGALVYFSNMYKTPIPIERTHHSTIGALAEKLKHGLAL